jgi:hypothetical protein
VHPVILLVLYKFDKIFARKSMGSGNDGIASHTLAMTTRYFYFDKVVLISSTIATL